MVVNGNTVSGYIEVDVTTADTSLGAGDFSTVSYKIEGYDIADLLSGSASAKTITISFTHKHTKTGIHCVSLRNGAGDRSYVFEYTQSVANTEETHEETIALDQSGTWLTTNGIGILLRFCSGAGSTWHTSADTWAAGNYVATSNQVNDMDNASNYFRITDVQFELGSVATALEYRPYGKELALCQRYYFKETAADIYSGFALSMVEAATYSSGMVRGLPVTMRASPTCNTASTRLFDGTVPANVTSLGPNRSSPTTWGLTLVASSGGLTVGRGVSLQANNNTAAYIEASAEL